MLFVSALALSFVSVSHAIRAVRTRHRVKKAKRRAGNNSVPNPSPNPSPQYSTVELEKCLALSDTSLFLVPYVENGSVSPTKFKQDSFRAAMFVYIEPKLWNYLLASVATGSIKELSRILSREISAFNTPYPQHFVMVFAGDKTVDGIKGTCEMTVNLNDLFVELFIGDEEACNYNNYPTLRDLLQDAKVRDFGNIRVALGDYSRYPTQPPNYAAYHQFYNESAKSLSFRESLSLLSAEGVCVSDEYSVSADSVAMSQTLAEEQSVKLAESVVSDTINVNEKFVLVDDDGEDDKEEEDSDETGSSYVSDSDSGYGYTSSEASILTGVADSTDSSLYTYEESDEDVSVENDDSSDSSDESVDSSGSSIYSSMSSTKVNETEEADFDGSLKDLDIASVETFPIDAPAVAEKAQAESSNDISMAQYAHA